jgi:ornithine carbamoyltransferase
MAFKFMNPEVSRGLAGRDLLSISSLNATEIEAVFELAAAMKCNTVTCEEQRRILSGKVLAMIFEKPSLRTRVSFEAGMFQLGGHAIYLLPSDISLGKRETIADVAHNLERMVDIIMARVFKNETVTHLAQHAAVPVINGLCDMEHPCQALADFFTVKEIKGTCRGMKLAFIGDGNNVAHSLMLLAARLGAHFAIGCPAGYEPCENVVSAAIEDGKQTGSTISVVNDPYEAAADADVVYTDVWASMGQEEEKALRAQAFASYRVDAELMSKAKPDAIFEHCLPAHRGDEVTDEVIDSAQSVVFQEAENRLHVQKAVMALLAGKVEC